uniref:Uncharacterized protein n=1 Tax=Klebsiella pneumoniae TaxID=573 RepID=A0A8B0SW50_KLEPN|nr:hypothetical protein [Klebsiella pneumoniae]
MVKKTEKNPTRSSFFCPTKNQGLEWMNSNPRMQIAHIIIPFRQVPVKCS